MKTKKIILCATQRCGSTMICEDMRNTQVLGLPEEYFIPWEKGKSNNWRKALSGIETKGQTENGVFAVKIMSDQIFHINACMAEFYNQDDCKNDFMFHHFKDAHWVFIRRKNIIRQSLSRYMSRKTGVNHLKASEGGYTPGNVQVGEKVKYSRAIEFDGDAIYDELSKIAYENKIWEQKFNKHKIVPTVLVYEDIVKSGSTAYLQPLIESMGVEEPVADVYEKRTLRKIANSLSESMFQKFVNL